MHKIPEYQRNKNTFCEIDGENGSENNSIIDEEHPKILSVKPTAHPSFIQAREDSKKVPEKLKMNRAAYKPFNLTHQSKLKPKVVD